MTVRRFTALLVVLALASLRAGAQSDAPVRIDPLFKLDPQSRTQIELLMDSARTQGLPDSVLYFKAIEGISKRVPNKDILRVVRRLYQDLKSARSALGPVKRGELEAGVQALMAGLKPDELAKFANGPKGRSVEAALTVLTDLVGARGVPKEDALNNFVQLWQRGATDLDFINLRADVDKDIRNGIIPGKAFQSRVQAIRPGGRDLEL